MNREELIALADWLHHMIGVNSAIAHVPEMAAHIEQLRKWETGLRAQADSASTPAQAVAWRWRPQGRGTWLYGAIEPSVDRAITEIQALYTTPSPERTSDGVRTTFAGIADFIDTIRGPVLEALDQSKNRLEAIEEYRRGERAAIPTTKGTMETIKRARAALSSTPTDALPGTEKQGDQLVTPPEDRAAAE